MADPALALVVEFAPVSITKINAPGIMGLPVLFSVVALPTRERRRAAVPDCCILVPTAVKMNTVGRMNGRCSVKTVGSHVRRQRIRHRRRGNDSACEGSVRGTRARADIPWRTIGNAEPFNGVYVLGFGVD